MTYKAWTYQLLELYPPALRGVIADSLAALIAQHKKKTSRPINEVTPDIVTGISWRFLAMIANRGDLKSRRANMMTRESESVRKKAGLSMTDVVEDNCDTRY